MRALQRLAKEGRKSCALKSLWSIHASDPAERHVAKEVVRRCVHRQHILAARWKDRGVVFESSLIPRVGVEEVRLFAVGEPSTVFESEASADSVLLLELLCQRRGAALLRADQKERGKLVPVDTKRVVSLL